MCASEGNQLSGIFVTSCLVFIALGTQSYDTMISASKLALLTWIRHDSARDSVPNRGSSKHKTIRFDGLLFRVLVQLRTSNTSLAHVLA